MTVGNCVVSRACFLCHLIDSPFSSCPVPTTDVRCHRDVDGKKMAADGSATSTMSLWCSIRSPPLSFPCQRQPFIFHASWIRERKRGKPHHPKAGSAPTNKTIQRGNHRSRVMLVWGQGLFFHRGPHYSGYENHDVWAHIQGQGSSSASTSTHTSKLRQSRR